MKIQKLPIKIMAVVLFTFSAVAISQMLENHVSGGHGSGLSHGHDTGAMPIALPMPTETGQSAFAAIAEIVAILDNDPQTDWTTVNIDALRSHLVDMEQLVLSASVTTRLPDEKSIQFDISGTERTLEAIQRMVPTHTQMVREATGWDMEVGHQPDGVTLTIRTQSPDALHRIKALGFFGFMTIDAHHQRHHLQMARGESH